MSTTISQHDVWDVTQIVTMTPFNPGAFGAILMRGTRKVATAENSGRGGCNHYVWLARDRRARKDDEAALTRAARRALPTVTFEPVDHYVALLMDLAEDRHQRP